jgi:hypothetical protein
MGQLRVYGRSQTGVTGGTSGWLVGGEWKESVGIVVGGHGVLWGRRVGK